MIRTMLLCLFIALGPAWGQTVTLRSGEHGGFTRLVLTQPEPMGWDFGRSETGYVLRFRGKVAAFDLSTAFERIGRNRVSALQARPGEGLLALDLACPCHAVATPFRPGIVVIDIAEGEAPIGSPFEQRLDFPGTAVGGQPMRERTRPPRRPRDFVEAPKLPPLGPRRLGDRQTPPPFAQRLQIPDARASLLGEKLGRDLARSIASGAISPGQPAPPLPSRSRPVVLPAPESPKPTPPAVSLQLNTRAPGAPPSREPPPNGRPCVAPEHLDLAAWGDNRPPALQIADARQALLGEFDRPDAKALQKLTRLYLHLGFGVEALSLLHNFPSEDIDAPVLRALGALIEDQSVDETFAEMQGCDGPAALWSLLSQEILPEAVDKPAVLRAFSDLPPWLRREVLPRLSKRFLTAGDLLTAQSLEQSLSRAEPSAGPETALVSSQIDLARGESERAEAQLDQLALTNDLVAPEALVLQVEARLARGAPILAEQLTALETQLRSHRGTKAEAPLRRSLAKALVAGGHAQQAFEDIALQDVGLYPDLWIGLARHGTDAEVARQTLAPMAGSLRNLPPSTLRSLAARLVEAGFPQRALNLMEPLQDRDSDLLRAKAQLGLRDGRAALRHIAGSDDPQAIPIRAEALELLADYAGAEREWLAAGNRPRAERLTLLRQDYAALPNDLPPALISLASSLTPTQPLPAEPLAKARARLKAAATLREAALAVLQPPGL